MNSRNPLKARTRWVPALAVAAVALTAVLSAVMVTRSGAELNGIHSEAPAADREEAGTKVVKAPPLVAAMGAAAACANCGVVEAVVAIEGHARGQRQTVGYLMHVRMDDGTRQVVEHRGAMAAGSRVLVERGAVRVMPAQI
jgi:hypothetical protein